MRRVPAQYKSHFSEKGISTELTDKCYHGEEEQYREKDNYNHSDANDNLDSPARIGIGTG